MTARILAIEAEAIASERARIAEAMKGLKPWRYLHDGGEDVFVSLPAVLAIIELKED
jgi:hypothetical protein